MLRKKQSKETLQRSVLLLLSLGVIVASMKVDNKATKQTP